MRNRWYISEKTLNFTEKDDWWDYYDPNFDSSETYRNPLILINFVVQNPPKKYRTASKP